MLRIPQRCYDCYLISPIHGLELANGRMGILTIYFISCRLYKHEIEIPERRDRRKLARRPYSEAVFPVGPKFLRMALVRSLCRGVRLRNRWTRFPPFSNTLVRISCPAMQE